MTTDQMRGLAVTYRRALARAETARDSLRAAVLAAVDAGMSESEAARLAGVSRITVRAWRGKP